jgi:hypothetical protein
MTIPGGRGSAANTTGDTRMTVVIFGPQCSGKTFHAERFREFFGCSEIIDDWFATVRRNDHRTIGPSDLVLTNVNLPIIEKHLPWAKKVHISQARTALDLGAFDIVKWLNELKDKRSNDAPRSKKLVVSRWSASRSGNSLTIVTASPHPRESEQKLVNIRRITVIDGQAVAFAKDGTRFDIVCA